MPVSLRVLYLAILVALVLTPFGRIGAAGAHEAMPTASHCADRPGDAGKSAPMSIDCMIACAAMAPAAAPFFAPPPTAETAPAAAPAFALAGIRPEAEPPPPRS